MIERVAFFADKNEIENYFSFSFPKDSVFKAHYNLSPGHPLPLFTSNGESIQANPVRWGNENHKDKTSAAIPSAEALTELKNETVQKALLCISGFFVWKQNKQKENPFFVRMLNSPIMPVPVLLYSGKSSYFRIMTTDSNALIHPMSEKMPLLLDRNLALKWLEPGSAPGEIIHDATSLFLITDLSVLRVSKKINDPAVNDPKLIQPIPK